MSVLQYTSGKIWMVATYRKEPAEMRRRMPTQNIRFLSFVSALSQNSSPKYETTVAIGAARVKH
jgi:hypothetical protein